MVAAIEALGATTHYAYDVRDRLIVIDPLGARTTSILDENDRVLSRTDPLGRLTTFGYYAAGRLRERTDAAGDTARWTYVPSGRVETVGGGSPITIERDVLGRPIAIRENGRPDMQLSWDRASRLVESRRGELAIAACR